MSIRGNTKKKKERINEWRIRIDEVAYVADGVGVVKPCNQSCAIMQSANTKQTAFNIY